MISKFSLFLYLLVLPSAFSSSLKDSCELKMKGAARELNVKMDWDQVVDSGFISKLVRDPDFLHLDLDLRKGSPKMSLAQFQDILDLPIVQQNIGAFVRDVLIGKSNVQFNVAGTMGEILEPAIFALGRAGDSEVFRSKVLPLAKNNQLQVILWTAAFEKAPSAPNIKAIADGLASAKAVEVIHTTRSIQPAPQPGSNPHFTKFAAGRFGVSVTQADGSQLFFVMETESTVGHLAPVDPGSTRVNGYVRMVQSTEELYKDNAGVLLSQRDSGELLRRLLKEWGYPSQIKGDTDRSTVLNSLAAIYSNGDPQKLTP